MRTRGLIKAKMGRPPMEMSPYSLYFKVLMFIGAWPTDSWTPWIRNWGTFFQTFMTVFAIFMCFLLYMDFYMVFGNLKRMMWNLCISLFFSGWFIKQFSTLRNVRVINSLRRKLHRREVTTTPDDEELNRLHVSQLKRIEMTARVGMVISIPMWIVSFYFGFMWGERSMPLPLWIPFEVDCEDELQFHLLFAIGSVLGIAATVFVLTVELAMLSLLIQISREYSRLTKDFTKINNLYEDRFSRRGEVVMAAREMNPYLRECLTKRLLKELIIRQEELIEYTRDFEMTYRYPMLLQVCASSGFLVVCGMQCLLEGHISMGIFFVLGYFSLILLDLLFVCSYVTRLRSQCYSVGEAAYSLFWYRMGTDIRKNICMIIMRSQRPPKITSGKMMETDLHSFMIMMKSIYSWLTVFRQLAFKSDQ